MDLAYRLGQLASQLAEQPEMQPYRARIAVPVQYIINHRCVHHRDSLAPLLAGYQAGLESGDPEAAVLCALCYVSHAYQLGLPLGELERQINDFAATVAQFGQRAIELALAINHQAVLNLLGRAADPLQLTGERCDEETVLSELEQSHNRGTLTSYLMVKAHLAYLFHDTEAALRLADQMRPRLREIAGFFAYPRFLALHALIGLAACDQAGRAVAPPPAAPGPGQPAPPASLGPTGANEPRARRPPGAGRAGPGAGATRRGHGALRRGHSALPGARLGQR